MPQPVENLTYESVVDAASPGYPWTPAMANAAVPVDAGQLAYTPRLHPPSGAAVAYPVPSNPTDPYPSGGGGPALVSVALNSALSWPGRIDFKVTTGPSAIAIAAYLGAPGVPLDKATMSRYRCTVPPAATDAVVTIGDPSIVNIAVQTATLGRNWSGTYAHAIDIVNNLATISRDGVNWLAKSNAPIATPAFDAVCWSPALQLFCAVSASAGADGTRAMTSPDGAAWTARALPNGTWRDICWSPALNLFCAVRTDGTTTRVATSPNGTAWTMQTTPSINLRGVCWSPEKALFVAVGESGTGQRAMTSPNGVNWTIRTTPADLPWYAVCWAPELGMFCAVASTGTGNHVMTSPDGSAWTGYSFGLAQDGAWTTVCWSPTLRLFAALGATAPTGGTRCATSPDGQNWTYRVIANVAWQYVCWADALGMFIAVASTGAARIARSVDGITWVTCQNAPHACGWAGVCWAPEISTLCAVANTTGVNPETTWWEGLSVVPGDVWRAGVNIEAISGSLSFAFANQDRELLPAAPYTTTGLKRDKLAPTKIANWLGLSMPTDGSCTVSDLITYRETPLALPQGLFDVHVCPVDAVGVEGTVTKFSNVNIV